MVLQRDKQISNLGLGCDANEKVVRRFNFKSLRLKTVHCRDKNGKLEDKFLIKESARAVLDQLIVKGKYMTGHIIAMDVVV
jgi:hypothetical protein